MFPLGEDATEYRKLTSDFVSTADFDGEEVLVVDPEGIKQLSAQAFVERVARHLAEKKARDMEAGRGDE